MYLFISLYAIGIVGFLVHSLFLPRNKRTRSKLIEIFLLYQIVFSLGIPSLIAYVGLMFFGPAFTEFVGWQTSGFDQELANFNLAFGVLGILSIWLRKYFWVATILGFSIWSLIGGFQRISQEILLGNPVGVPLYTDILVPAVLILGLYLYYKNNLEPATRMLYYPEND